MIGRLSPPRFSLHLLGCGLATFCALVTTGCRTIEGGTAETSTGLQYQPQSPLTYVENPGVYVGEKSGYPTKPVR